MRGICTQKIRTLSKSRKSRFPLNVAERQTDRRTNGHMDGHSNRETSLMKNQYIQHINKRVTSYIYPDIVKNAKHYETQFALAFLFFLRREISVRPSVC